MLVIGIALTIIGLIVLNIWNNQVDKNLFLRPLFLAHRPAMFFLFFAGAIPLFLGVAILSQINTTVLFVILGATTFLVAARYIIEKSRTTEVGRIRKVISIYKNVIAQNRHMDSKEALRKTWQQYSWQLLEKENVSVAPLNAMIERMFEVLENHHNAHELDRGLPTILFLTLTYLEGINTGKDSFNPDYSSPALNARGALIDKELARSFQYRQGTVDS